MPIGQCSGYPTQLTEDTFTSSTVWGNPVTDQ